MGQLPYYLPCTSPICVLLHTKLKEFLDLEQRNRNVFDYMRQFNTLAQYGSYHFDMDEKRPTCTMMDSPSTWGSAASTTTATELGPGTTPVTKAPYKMSPVEMKDLKVHLQGLLDKGYIRLSTSP
jgi:hypothetical protein